ncbi:hypothetical protein [Peribacillus frigoritolerans]|uniref:hypothetical protein n=1 Tax=Peribacillus frigoritolerans TaxID=450367 RepID=UPI00215AC225|nr:hypothetical protein [Peribacillus frigoritolerans]MCR8867463.1 hypothetical protein [Peribacillus frigoritolerans]
MANNKKLVVKASTPTVTADQVILNLKNLGVVFEKNTKPFAIKDNTYASAMGNYEKRLVIK